MSPRKLDPAEPPKPGVADAAALAALYLGRATDDQQKRAFDWMLRHACRTFSTTFHPDPYVAAFNQGRRQAGLDIMNATTTSPEAAKLLEDKEQA